MEAHRGHVPKVAPGCPQGTIQDRPLLKLQSYHRDDEMRDEFHALLPTHFQGIHASRFRKGQQGGCQASLCGNASHYREA